MLYITPEFTMVHPLTSEGSSTATTLLSQSVTMMVQTGQLED